MDTGSHDVSARARNNQQMMLNKLASTGQSPVSKALGVHESTISRMKEQEGAIAQIAMLCAIVGLKVVPIEMRCFDPKDIDTILHQAKRWVNHIGSSNDLEFDGE